MTQQGLMTTKEVAGMLRVTPSTVCRWRQQGTGPFEVEEALVWLSDRIPRYRRGPIVNFVEGK